MLPGYMSYVSIYLTHWYMLSRTSLDKTKRNSSLCSREVFRVPFLEIIPVIQSHRMSLSSLTVQSNANNINNKLQLLKLRYCKSTQST